MIQIQKHGRAGVTLKKNEVDYFIFGYGSIVNLSSLLAFLKKNELHHDDYEYCNLMGFRRTWNIAMDNTKDIAGYKWFRDPLTKNRPDIRVTFLNIYESHHEDFVNGILFRVTKSELDRIQKRELNYDLLEITDRLDIKVPGRAYAFIGKEEAKKRFEEGCKTNKSVISEDYKTLIDDSFANISDEFFKTYNETTDEAGVPLQKLEAIFSRDFYPKKYRDFFSHEIN